MGSIFDRLTSNSLLGSVLLARQRAKKNLEKEFASLHYARPEILAAMKYTLFPPGKCIRSMFVYLTGRYFTVPRPVLDDISSVLEIVHAASLIHDDLEFIDNGKERRGKQCCHIVFGEEIAIMAGDQLQTLASHILSRKKDIEGKCHVRMIKYLAERSGINGLVGGEYLDIRLLKQKIDLADLETIYKMKTSALICSACVMPAIAVGLEDDSRTELFKIYGESLGLAFQIKDDILDFSEENSGENRELIVTHPMICGLEQSQRRVAELCQRAREAATQLDSHQEIFTKVVNYFETRKF